MCDRIPYAFLFLLLEGIFAHTYYDCLTSKVCSCSLFSTPSPRSQRLSLRPYQYDPAPDSRPVLYSTCYRRHVSPLPIPRQTPPKPLIVLDAIRQHVFRTLVSRPHCIRPIQRRTRRESHLRTSRPCWGLLRRRIGVAGRRKEVVEEEEMPGWRTRSSQRKKNLVR